MITEIFHEFWQYLLLIDKLELLGLIFGLLAVLLLIKENILTWPFGILYCFVSFYIFWNAKLYQDFFLTFFFLVMNIYGWIEWKRPQKQHKQLQISTTSRKVFGYLLIIALSYIIITGTLFSLYTDAALPYADATTTGLSFIAMWMTAKKKIENWILWFIVDVLASIIYVIKGLDFYAVLYFVYIFLAIAGYYSWRKTLKTQLTFA